MNENVVIRGEKNKTVCFCMLIPSAILLLLGIKCLLNLTFVEMGHYVWYTHPVFYRGVVEIGLALILTLPYLAFSKVEITVTDKRVYGTAAFGKRVDLPIDSISTVAIVGIFNAICVSTSSGTIKFQLMANFEKLHSEISSLLILRQETNHKASEQTIISTPLSNAEELKKYKELLDAGIITQEEFDVKKRQLLDL